MGLEEKPSFRFLERWHIGFSRFSGPPEINPCHFGTNPFKGRAEYGEFSVDNYAPQWRWRNAVVGPNAGMGKGLSNEFQIMVNGDLDSPTDLFTLGQKRTDGEVRYAKHCSAELSSSFTSASATIVNAEYFQAGRSSLQGATTVRVGDNDWRFAEYPLADYSGPLYGAQPLLEAWELKIPETGYSLVFMFYASKKFFLHRATRTV